MKKRFVKNSMATLLLLVGAKSVGAQQTQVGRVEGVLSPQALRAANEALQQAEIDATGPEGYNLTLKADASQYSLNQAVNLRLEFANVSREITEIGYVPGLTFKLVVQRPDGTVAPLTLRGKQRDWIAHTFISPRGGGVSRGGAPWQESFQAVNYDFDMTQIGEYSLQVSREVPSIADPEKQVRIYSNVVNVTILSPDQQKQRGSPRTSGQRHAFAKLACDGQAAFAGERFRTVNSIRQAQLRARRSYRVRGDAEKSRRRHQLYGHTAVQGRDDTGRWRFVAADAPRSGCRGFGRSTYRRRRTSFARR